MSAWQVPLGIVLTVFGGIALAVQAGVNAALGNHITKAVAAIVSFGLGLVACCLYLLIDATVISKQLPSVADLQGAPWWAWIGGVLGAYYVIINISFAYKLGAGTAVAVFVCSQLGMSIVLDLTGLVGFQKRAFSWQRITGAALMIMGVILVTQFPGAPINPPNPQDPESQQQLNQNQQQQQVKQLKQASLQAASAASLLPTAADVGGSSSSVGSGVDSNGSSGSLQLAGMDSSGAVGSGRRLRGMGGVHAGQRVHLQQLHQRHHHQQQYQDQQQADVEMKVVEH